MNITADTTIAVVGAPDGDALLRLKPGFRGPEYPADLRSLREGTVRASFVVDAEGRVIRGTVLILEETHRGFGTSVCRYLEQATFLTRPVDGRAQTIAVSDATFAFSFGR